MVKPLAKGAKEQQRLLAGSRRQTTRLPSRDAITRGAAACVLVRGVREPAQRVRVQMSCCLLATARVLESPAGEFHHDLCSEQTCDAICRIVLPEPGRGWDMFMDDGCMRADATVQTRHNMGGWADRTQDTGVEGTLAHLRLDPSLLSDRRLGGFRLPEDAAPNVNTSKSD